MKSLLEINLSVLNEYDNWKNANQNWNVDEYINVKYDMNAALSFAKLYFPDFIENKGCIILATRYKEQTFNEWYTHFNGKIKDTEYMCNLYEVMDFFSNREEYESDIEYNLALDEFAKALKNIWEINLKLLYPNRKIVVEVFDEYDTTRITIFTEDD